jgi:hypothetical protein
MRALHALHLMAEAGLLVYIVVGLALWLRDLRWRRHDVTVIGRGVRRSLRKPVRFPHGRR